MSWWWWYRHNPTAYDDDWEDQPTQGAFDKWGLGVALPVALLAFGAYAMIARSIGFAGWGDVSITLHGLNAVAYGIAWASAAVFLHCHYFWGNIYDQAWFAVLGKTVSGCAFIAGLGFLIVRNGIFGRV